MLSLRRTLPTAALAAVAALVAVAVVPTTPAAPAYAADPAPNELAAQATATASSVELDRADFAATFANDGNSSTRWSSSYVDDNWLQLALAVPSPVAVVQVDWPNACARAFEVQTSVDGESWTTRATLADQTTCGRTDTIEIDTEGDVKFVRVQGQKRWSTYGYSISEIRLYDGALPEPEPQLPLVPQPASLDRGEGSYQLASDVTISASGEGAAGVGEYLAGTLRASTGFAVPVTETPGGQIAIRIESGLAPAGHQQEGYTLAVTAEGISIGADTAAGARNGVQTLRQLLPQWVESDSPVVTDWSVPQVSISDYPRFAYRGLMVDSARSFYTVDEIKRLIDSAAPLKINRLHLHLTDDQGWRLALDNPVDPAANPSGIAYTDLTEISGATAMTYRANGELMGTELGRTGFYTKADYRAIIDYAADNGMTVVPEIDLPGHTNAALHAIPQLNSAGSSPKLKPGETTVPHQGTGDVGISSFDANNDATYEFITEVLRQVAELTPGELLHIGGDEAHNTSHADYQKMVDFASQTVADLGKTVVGWNEYASTNLPQDDAVVQYWNGGGQAVANAVANRGAKVILSPANKTYMPQKQDSRQPNGGTWACGGPCTLENAYNWDPAAHISGVGESAVLGVETAFWGEFIRGVDQAQYYTFPRVLAIAEAGWSPQDVKQQAEFIDRVGQLGGRMTVDGVNFFPTASVDWRAGATATSASVTALAGNTDEAARVDWRVTAPGVNATDLTATVSWDGGEATAIDLTQGSVGDIALMRAHGEFVGSSESVLTEPGAHTAVLVVAQGDDVVATAETTVTVADDEGAGAGAAADADAGANADANAGAGAGAGADAGAGAGADAGGNESASGSAGEANADPGNNATGEQGSDDNQGASGGQGENGTTGDNAGTAPRTPQTPQLASTGSSTMTAFTAVGALLAAAGAVLVLRRRSATAATTERNQRH